jgi:hypothetical protein
LRKGRQAGRLARPPGLGTLPIVDLRERADHQRVEPALPGHHRGGQAAAARRTRSAGSVDLHLDHVAGVPVRMTSPVSRVKSCDRSAVHRDDLAWADGKSFRYELKNERRFD